jgi:hypothetical protein
MVYWCESLARSVHSLYIKPLPTLCAPGPADYLPQIIID